MIRKNLTGLVLCGGKSRRMGEDKGMMLEGNEHWVSKIADKLRRFTRKVVISVNATQHAHYVDILSPSYQLCVDKNYNDIPGPIKGLFSAQDTLPCHDFLVAPCDVKDMDEAFVSLLLNHYRKANEDIDAIIPMVNNEIEPICGIYTGKFVKRLKNKYFEGAIRNVSMKELLAVGNVEHIEVTKDQYKFFKNYNSPADLINL